MSELGSDVYGFNFSSKYLVGHEHTMRAHADNHRRIHKYEFVTVLTYLRELR